MMPIISALLLSVPGLTYGECATLNLRAAAQPGICSSVAPTGHASGRGTALLGSGLLRDNGSVYLLSVTAQRPKADCRNLVSRAKQLIEEHLGVEPEKIRNNARFSKDLNADESDIADLVLTAEERFNVNIDDRTTRNIKVVGDFIAAIRAACM